MGDEELVYHKQNGFLEIGVECLLHFVKSDQEGLVVMVLVVDYIPKVPVANGRRLPIATCQAVWHVYRDGVVVLTSSLKKHTFYNLLINNILYLCVT